MAEPEVSPSAVSEDDKRRLLARLARVEGQLRGIQRMIEREEECEAIAQQLAAARGALNKAFVELIGCALEHRLAGGERRGSELQQEISHIVALLSRYT